MDVDFVEIGTSNFHTLIQTCSDAHRGFSIDAISYYLKSLPDKPNVKKIHAAITSNRTCDTIDVYYIPEIAIETHRLPSWFKGCNRIGEYHPLHISWNIKHLVTIETVPLINIDEFLEKHNIRKIRYMKIDTEGHDAVILRGLFKYIETKPLEYFPDTIEFESNEWMSDKEFLDILNKYISLGYNVKSMSRESDTILTLLPINETTQ